VDGMALPNMPTANEAEVNKVKDAGWQVSIFKFGIKIRESRDKKQIAL